MTTKDSLEGDRSVGPALWNPRVALYGSLLLTPIFGAYLHARNWRVLGKPEHARKSMMWVWGIATIYLIAFVFAYLDSVNINGMLLWALTFFPWWFLSGKQHEKYVNQTFPDGYNKKSDRPFRFIFLAIIIINLILLSFLVLYYFDIL